VLFVKNFEGNPCYQEQGEIGRVCLGRRAKVYFKDGEKLVGYTQGFWQNRLGFIFSLPVPIATIIMP
jgi:hypothetical protein